MAVDFLSALCLTEIAASKKVVVVVVVAVEATAEGTGVWCDLELKVISVFWVAVAAAVTFDCQNLWHLALPSVPAAANCCSTARVLFRTGACCWSLCRRLRAQVTRSTQDSLDAETCQETWRVANLDVEEKDKILCTLADLLTVVVVVLSAVVVRRVLLELEAGNASVQAVVVAACFVIELRWTFVAVAAAVAVVVVAVQTIRFVLESQVCWMKTAAEMKSVFFVVAAVAVVVVDIDGRRLPCSPAFGVDSIARRSNSLPPTSVMDWSSVVVAVVAKELAPGWQGNPSSAGTWPRGLT